QDDVVAMIAGVEPLTRDVFSKASKLKVISRCGMGLDSIDLAAAEEYGVLVYNTPDAPVQAVAELTLGMMLSLLRHIARADRGIRAGHWRAHMGGLLAARIVGLVGYGRIGGRLRSCLEDFKQESWHAISRRLLCRRQVSRFAIWNRFSLCPILFRC